jgi:hypothetical protein
MAAVRGRTSRIWSAAAIATACAAVLVYIVPADTGPRVAQSQAPRATPDNRDRRAPRVTAAVATVPTRAAIRNVAPPPSRPLTAAQQPPRVVEQDPVASHVAVARKPQHAPKQTPAARGLIPAATVATTPQATVERVQPAAASVRRRPVAARVGAQPAVVRVRAQPAVVRVRAQPAAARLVSAVPDETHLMAQYQRVGRRLLVLERGFGAAAVSDVAPRFRWIKLESAMATPTSRKLLARTLRDLLARLDHRLAAACSRAPDANPCRK